MGRSIRLVGSGLLGRLRVRKHEEYDANGAVDAVYDSRSHEPAQIVDGQDRGPDGFVKHSLHGWVLRRSGAGRRTWTYAGEGIPSAVFQPPSMRWAMERQVPT